MHTLYGIESVESEMMQGGAAYFAKQDSRAGKAYGGTQCRHSRAHSF